MTDGVSYILVSQLACLPVKKGKRRVHFGKSSQSSFSKKRMSSLILKNSIKLGKELVGRLV